MTAIGPSAPHLTLQYTPEYESACATLSSLVINSHPGDKIESMTIRELPKQSVIFLIEGTFPKEGHFEVRGNGPVMSWQAGIVIDAEEGISWTALPCGEYFFKVVYVPHDGSEELSQKGANIPSSVLSEEVPITIKF